MTDFDARAREIVAAIPKSEPMSLSVLPMIAAALKAAYNAGLEDAANEVNDDCCEWSGIRGGCSQDHAAERVRAKKVPT